LRLITSKKSPMEIILSFHPTTPRDIISHSHAYSLSPKAAFDQQRALIITTSGSGQEIGRKYRDRGWKLFECRSAFEVTNSDSEFQAALRRVGDKECLTLSLTPIPSLNALVKFPYHEHISSWNMKYARYNKARLEHNMLLCPVFSYCATGEDAVLKALDESGVHKELDRLTMPTKELSGKKPWTA
ncbi:hypothetical protein EDD18DRAFT_1062607, partial [Armillaria luteobubalina]